VSWPEDTSNDLDSEPRFGLDLRDVDDICSAILKSNRGWKKPKSPLGLSPIDWTPNLVTADGNACHIHVVERLAGHWTQRMKVARASKIKLSVAAPLVCWHSDETLMATDDLNAEPILLEREHGSWKIESYASVARLIASQKLLLKPESIKVLGLRLLERARKAKGPNPRGKFFEDFLAFLFSQIPDFEVFEQNYRTETEEIDIIINNRRTNGRAWPPNAPLILVSGKNKLDTVGTPAVTSLESKMDKRRGMCRLGFLCASGSFSSDAYNHELRFSVGQNVLVFLDGKTLEKLLAKPDKLTVEMEKLVIQAALR